MDSDDEDGRIALLSLVTSGVGFLINAAVLAILWDWFAVELFGLPQLTLFHAAGVLLLAEFLTHQPFSEDECEDVQDALGRATARRFIRPGWALAVGWVIHLFM